MGCQSHINCGFRTCGTDTTKCNNTVNNLDNFFIFDGVQNNKKVQGRLATYFKVGDPLVSLYNYSSRIMTILFITKNEAFFQSIVRLLLLLSFMHTSYLKSE